MENESVSIHDSPQYQRVETVNQVEPVATEAVRPQQAAVLLPESSASRTSSTRRFSPDAMIAALLGLVLTIMGLIAITRGGFKGSMDVPIVQVLGFTHTTSLGLIEIGMGVALLLAGAFGSRSGAGFFGSVLGIGAFVGAVQTSSFRRSLALESGFAWLVVVGAVVVVLSSLLIPRYTKRSTVVHSM